MSTQSRKRTTGSHGIPALALAATVAAVLQLQPLTVHAAEIHGTKWNDADGNGMIDVGELGVPNVTICLDGGEGGFQGELGDQATLQIDGAEGTCTITEPDGSYWFMDVEAGEHTVHEVLPFGSANTTPISQLVNVAVDEVLTDVDFGNRIPMVPPPEVTIDGDSDWDFNGLPVVHYNNPTTYTKDVTAHCGVASPLAVKLVIGPFSDTGNTQEMMMTNTGGENWAATFPPFFPDHGLAALTFYVDCPPDTAGFPEDEDLIAGEDEIQDGGNIYVDPSGRIVSACDGSPIEDAVVTVLLEDVFSPGDFFPAPASTPPLIPDVNPQFTGPDGSYGWVVTPGTYKVHATHPGFVGPVESAELVIPPAVTDLDLAMTPLAGCPMPEERIADLIDEIQALVDADEIKKGDGKKLIKKLEKALKKFANDKGSSKYIKKTVKELNKFIKEVNKLVDKGKLDMVTGTAWIAIAEGIIAEIS